MSFCCFWKLTWNFSFRSSGSWVTRVSQNWSLAIIAYPAPRHQRYPSTKPHQLQFQRGHSKSFCACKSPSDTVRYSFFFYYSILSPPFVFHFPTLFDHHHHPSSHSEETTNNGKISSISMRLSEEQKKFIAMQFHSVEYEWKEMLESPFGNPSRFTGFFHSARDTRLWFSIGNCAII